MSETLKTRLSDTRNALYRASLHHLSSSVQWKQSRNFSERNFFYCIFWETSKTSLSVRNSENSTFGHAKRSLPCESASFELLRPMETVSEFFGEKIFLPQKHHLVSEALKTRLSDTRNALYRASLHHLSSSVHWKQSRNFSKRKTFYCIFWETSKTSLSVRNSENSTFGHAKRSLPCESASFEPTAQRLYHVDFDTWCNLF